MKSALTMRTLKQLSLITGTSVVLGACQWVDSTGVQTETDVGAGPLIQMVEESTTELDFSSLLAREFVSTAKVQSWSRIDEGSLTECAGLLDLQKTADSLREACSPLEDVCNLVILQAQAADGDPDLERYTVFPPRLSSPIGIKYQWILGDGSDATKTHDITFCVDAVDDVPVAIDDEFSTTPSATLEVDGAAYDESCMITTDAQTILGNDQDDLHLRQGCPVALLMSIPAYASNDFASSFTDDGGFTYTPDPARPEPEDRFTYQMFDGSHYSEVATVVLRSGIEAIADRITVKRNSKNNVLYPLANDRNPFNGALGITAVSRTPNRGGTAIVMQDNSINYRPAARYRGVEIFEYTMMDVYGQQSTARVTVTVN